LSEIIEEFFDNHFNTNTKGTLFLAQSLGSDDSSFLLGSELVAGGGFCQL
jgi:hypothetical protein